MAQGKTLEQHLLKFPRRQSVNWVALWEQVHLFADLYPDGGLVNRAVRLRWDMRGEVVRKFSEVGRLMWIKEARAQYLCNKGVFYLQSPGSKSQWCIGYDLAMEFWDTNWTDDSNVYGFEGEGNVATDSQLEILALAQFRQAGFPEPERNVKDWIPERKLEADFLWRFPDHPTYNGLVVEIQGGIWLRGYLDKRGISRGRGHAHPAKIEDDAEKCSLGQLAGYIVLQVTEKALNSGDALEWVSQCLQIGGLTEQEAT